MGLGYLAVIMGTATLISYLIPFKFDKEIRSILYYGYEDLQFDEQLLAKGSYYNFGHYSLRIRFLTIDIESIAKDKVVWSSPIDQSFLSCSSHHELVDSHEDSFYEIDDTYVYERCSQQIVTDIKKKVGNSLVISGNFADCEDVYFEVEFQELEGFDGKPKLEFQAKCQSKSHNINRIYFRTRSNPMEKFYGLGEQFSHANLKGKIFNTMVREKGIGRGDEPLTTIANAIFNNAGGRYANTYNPSTITVSTQNRSIYLDTKAYTIWDFMDPWSVNILVWDQKLKGQFISAPDMKRLITRVTQITGRMSPLPKWIQKGAVIGIQGGTEKLQEVISRLEVNDVPLSGFWIQDWVNRRYSEGYSRLWWNWELDKDHYPKWSDVVQKLLKKDVRIMTYINPMLTEVSERPHRRNLFKEAKELGYLIHNNQTGELFQTRAFSTFTAGLLDLTNPDAVRWYKKLIKTELLHNTQVYGFMADFGEAAPIGGQNVNLDDPDISPMEFHQTYPIIWQKLVNEAIEEYCQEQDITDDYVFFTRSGYTQTPGLSRLVWAGDQNQNWGRHNGLKSGVVALLSAGFSGISLIHIDVGGYTYINNEFNDHFPTKTLRDKDLLIRSMEVSAFTPVFRSHEGNFPDKAVQPYDEEMIHYLRRNAYIFKYLAEYRSSLMKQSVKNGIPLIRALVLEYQSDSNVHDIVDQFMLGGDLMIAPVLEPQTFSRKVYFPRVAAKYSQNFWVHVWTGRKISGCACYRMIDAPYDKPPVFYPYLSDWDKTFDQIFKDMEKIH